jgi:hypothetical protein
MAVTDQKQLWQVFGPKNSILPDAKPSLLAVHGDDLFVVGSWAARLDGETQKWTVWRDSVAGQLLAAGPDEVWTAQGKHVGRLVLANGLWLKYDLAEVISDAEDRKEALSHPYCNSIFIADNSVWLAAGSRPIRFDKKQNSWSCLRLDKVRKPLPLPSDLKQAIRSDYSKPTGWIRSVCELDGKLWFAAGQWGGAPMVYAYDLRDETVEWVTALARYETGALWPEESRVLFMALVGLKTTVYGAVDPKTYRVTEFGKSELLSSAPARVPDLYDPGFVWLYDPGPGSRLRGVLRVNVSSDVASPFTAKNCQLPSDQVRSVACTRDGVWISTAAGLARFSRTPVPRVNRTTPVDKATDVPTDTRVTFAMNDDIVQESVGDAPILLTQEGQASVPGEGRYHADRRAFEYMVAGRLAPGVTYRAVLKSGFRNRHDQLFGKDHVITFTTAR